MPVHRIAIAGLGTIGRVIARQLADGIPGLVLACAAVRDRSKAQAWLDAERIACPLVEPEQFPAQADLVVECAPAAALERICRPMLEAGKQVMVLSAGALLPRPDLIELAKARGGQIIVPTGALLGLDAVTAAAEGRIHSVRMVTRKPPHGLAGAPYLEQNRIAVEELNAPKRVFSGTARAGAAGFPANVNVAAALSLAGIGADRTMMEIGRIRPLTATATPSRLTAIPPASRSQSRTSPRKIPKPDGSPRFRLWRPCASWRRPCGWELDL